MSAQGTQEWHQERLGRATASRVADIIARTKSGYSASRANYAAQLVIERLTGQVSDTYTNAAMQHGIDTEPNARAAYEFRYDVSVEQVGFIPHPRIAMSGASPDGQIGNDGLLEIKCPNSATHIEALLTEIVPEKYVTQIQWQLACTGRKWADYLSFDPRMPEAMRMFVKRIPRDDAMIAGLEKDVAAFLAEINATIQKLSDKFNPIGGG